MSGQFLVPPNWDCNHVGGERRPSQQNGPGCYAQDPVRFQGRSERFPQVREGRVGGLTERPPGR